MVKKGDLIRIRPGEAISALNGRLWVVTTRGQEDIICGGHTVYAKSLASGTECVWFPHEYDIGGEDGQEG